ncbi:hypothetical protein Bbelb_351870 [Branchiostoma belcheri]|nr:hypothetical protein Bbelb_351870 [Branchiostoma belcheri]
MYEAQFPRGKLSTWSHGLPYGRFTTLTQLPNGKHGNVTISGQHRVTGTSPFRANIAQRERHHFGPTTRDRERHHFGPTLRDREQQDLQKLQRMQNRAGRLLLGAPHRTPSAEVRNRLGWKDPGTSVAAFKNRLRRDEHFVFVVEEPVVVSVINYAINSTVERFPYCGKFSTSVAALSGEVPVRDSALLGGEIPVSGNLSPSVAQFPHGKLSYSRDPA